LHPCLHLCLHSCLHLCLHLCLHPCFAFLSSQKLFCRGEWLEVADVRRRHRSAVESTYRRGAIAVSSTVTSAVSSVVSSPRPSRLYVLLQELIRATLTFLNVSCERRRPSYRRSLRHARCACVLMFPPSPPMSQLPLLAPSPLLALVSSLALDFAPTVASASTPTSTITLTLLDAR
jgi:hypothetical protein